jgi:CheY-like chemotaxis protein
MPTRILIADDNPAVRDALRNLLEIAEFGDIVAAENGREAIEKAQELRPNLIILDLVMPGMDGLAAARELSKIMPEVPLLMHTLHWSPQVELEAQKVGVRKVIAKADAKSLLIAVQELLSAAPAAVVPGGAEAVPTHLLPTDVASLPPVVDASKVTPAEPSDVGATTGGAEDGAGEGSSQPD